MATKQKQPKKGISNAVRIVLFWTILVLGVLTVMALTAPNTNLKEVPISSVIERANKGEVTKIEGTGNDLTITVKGQDKPTEKSYIQGGVSTLLKDDILSKEARSLVKDSAP